MKTSYVAVIIVVIALVAVGGYYAISSMKASPTAYSTSASTAPTTVKSAPNIPYTTTMLANTSSTSNAVTIGNVLASNRTYAVKIAYNSTVGNYLADYAGLTLYQYKVDAPYSNTSACNSGCDGTWIPFYNSTTVLSPGLSASSFTTITRSDGSLQLVYEGYPLYTYVHDTQAGQIGGEGKGGVWYAYVVQSTASANITVQTTTAATTAATTSTSGGYG